MTDDTRDDWMHGIERDPKPRLYVGQRVTVQSAALGERTATIRRFKWNEDGDNLVVVDVDSTRGPALTGWVFEERQVTPLQTR